MSVYYAPDEDLDHDDLENEWVHIDEIPDLDHAKKAMKKVLDILYRESSMDDLEENLENVCDILSLPLPAGHLKIKKLR